MSDPLDGLRPTGPPPELRGRVLAAAREAAEMRAPGLLELLLADRALRVCMAVLAVLLLAHVFVADVPQLPASAPPAAMTDEIAVPAETGLTAAEQIPELEPAL